MAEEMKSLEDLLDANWAWAARMRLADPGFLVKLAERQSPEFLWIGCADSRVPVNRILDAPPGSVFVHRNIANLAGEDIGSLAVIQYAVEVLEVGHIVVCGHYGCGGVRAAMADGIAGPLGEWIAPIRKTYGKHRVRIDAASDRKERENRLCELNVLDQVERISKVEYVRNAWRSGRGPSVHGLVYDLAAGTLKNLECSRSAPGGRRPGESKEE